jgi:hypothetical protein
VLSPDDGTENYKADATWWIRPGLADESWVSFESYAQPGKYMGRMFGVMALVDLASITSDSARADATFLEEREAEN